MKISSAKAKGRRAAKKLRDAIVGAFAELIEGDVIATPSSVPGEDILLSPAAQKLVPFTFEVKNQEALNIWRAILQAEEHSKKTGRAPALAFTRNNADMWIAVRLESFVSMLQQSKK